MQNSRPNGIPPIDGVNTYVDDHGHGDTYASLGGQPGQNLNMAQLN